MHIRFISSATALAALAGQVTAEARQPYRPELGRMTIKSLVGRQEPDGYSPDEEFCGAGNTCAEACGASFRECASNDGATHCFNPAANQQCCPSTTGDSCDGGYYCAKDTLGEVWCCPEEMTIRECAAIYDVAGGQLIVPKPTTTSSSTTSSSTTSTSSTKTSTEETTTTSKPETTKTSSTEEGTTSTTTESTSSTKTSTGTSDEGPTTTSESRTKTDSTRTTNTATTTDPSSLSTSTQDLETDATEPAAAPTTTSAATTSEEPYSPSSSTETHVDAPEATESPATGQGSRTSAVLTFDATLLAAAFVIFSLL